MKKVMTCSVVGARGYAGLETARLLLQHPGAKLTHCFATSPFELSRLVGGSRAAAVKCLLDSEVLNHAADVVFLATPAEVSLSLAPRLLATGRKVIDLSGAFRLKKSDYRRWYGFEHTEPEALAGAQYGLSPFAGPQAPALIANPGCYATAISLALIPVLQAGLIDGKSIVIDAKSGTTGAGKKANEALLFSEVEGECLPYKVGRHQHFPEIVEAIESHTGKTIEAHLTTSLLPVRRGIIAGIYARLWDGLGADEVRRSLARAYSGYRLVSFAGVDEEPALLQLKSVVGTGRTHLSFQVEGNRLYLFSCIDNLMKGAASQAIENYNRLNDFPLWTGIEQREGLI